MSVGLCNFEAIEAEFGKCVMHPFKGPVRQIFFSFESKCPKNIEVLVCKFFFCHYF